MSERIPIVIALILTAAITLTLAVIVWRKRATGKAAVFLAICIAGVAVYSFGYGMELLSNTLKTAMFWVRFQHVGIQVIAPAWLLFALSIAGYEKKLTTKWIIALFIIPLCLFLSAETLGWLNLFHHNPRMDTSGVFPIFTYDRNIFNYISIGYFSLCILSSTVLFVLMLFRTASSSRQQAVLYLLGSIPPGLGLVPYNLSVGVDYTPLALGLSGILFAIGFIRLRILDIIPLARDSVFEEIRSGVMILDIQDRIVDFNPALQAIFPFLESSTKDPSVYDVFSDHPALLKLIGDKSEERVELIVENDEVPSYYRVSMTSMDDRRDRPVGAIVSFYEFTQEKHLLKELERTAALDGLTGIYNRPYFDQYAIKEINRVKRYGGVVSMIYLDLDHFKATNDTYGHAAGDLTLQKVAETLHKNIRLSDVLARFGGEEFVILLPQTDVLAAKALAERLCKALADLTVQFEGHNISARASFGVTGFSSGSALNLEILYRLADRAMYHAKSLGGNRVSVCLLTDTDETLFVE